VRFIELDLGPTQEYKKRRVADVLGSLPANVRYVPIDFTREKLADVLRKAGYRQDQKSFFIWEGVTCYLPEEAIRETLRFVASQAPGSVVVADFVRRSVIDALAKGPGDDAPLPMRAAVILARRAADFGEPWLFGIPDGGEKEYLHALGLEVTERTSVNAPESIKRYRTRRDGSVVGPVASGDYTAVVLLEAAVPER
jgi:methyltransferase (TIGR00027 family)